MSNPTILHVYTATPQTRRSTQRQRHERRNTNGTPNRRSQELQIDVDSVVLNDYGDVGPPSGANAAARPNLGGEVVLKSLPMWVLRSFDVIYRSEHRLAMSLCSYQPSCSLYS